MNELWKWMIEQKYAFEWEYSSLFKDSIKRKKVYYLVDGQSEIQPNKRMLIGYMIEYLAEHGHFLGMANATGKRIGTHSFETIESYFDRLVHEINRREEHEARKSNTDTDRT